MQREAMSKRGRVAAGTPARDAWARRELMPVVTESVWIGGVFVRVVRWKHWTLWEVSGDLDGAAPLTREYVADYIRSRAGLVRCAGAHDFVHIQVWHARRPGMRGGLTSRRSGNYYRGSIHVVSHR